MEDEREKEDETLFKKYFEEKEIEFMFPPETASEMQHQRNINIAKVSACIYHGIHGTDQRATRENKETVRNFVLQHYGVAFQRS